MNTRERPHRTPTAATYTRPGRMAQTVVVVAETPTRYRIRATRGAVVWLNGRYRSIMGEATALVPKTAITLRTAGPYAPVSGPISEPLP